jgi:MFS superfamily sulfate permease-like transporter
LKSKALPRTRSSPSDFLPASIQALRDYSLRTFTSDLIAGVTVGLVALPLAMALAISSGMTPQAGIYCAIVTGFLVSALGGSYVLRTMSGAGERTPSRTRTFPATSPSCAFTARSSSGRPTS